MRSVKIYSFLADALLEKSRLTDAGIECFVSGENAASSGYGGFLSEIRLCVADEDFAEAARVLSEQPEALPADAEFEAPALAASPPEPAVPEPSAMACFLGGGFAMLLLFGFLTLLAIAGGGSVRCDAGFLFGVFIVGGLLGSAARAFYIRGLRRGARNARDEQP